MISLASINPLLKTGILWSGVQINVLSLSNVNLITSAFLRVTPAQLMLPGTISPVSGLQLYAQFSLPSLNSLIISCNSNTLPSNKGILVVRSKHSGLYVESMVDPPPVCEGILRCFNSFFTRSM